MKKTNRVYPQSYVKSNSEPQNPFRQLDTDDNVRWTVSSLAGRIKFEIEKRNIFGWWPLSKGTKSKYWLEYFRTKDSWMDEATAETLGDEVAQLLKELKFDSMAHVEVKLAKDRQPSGYEYDCYFVDVVIPKPKYLN